jgi:hypothetical protein
MTPDFSFPPFKFTKSISEGEKSAPTHDAPGINQFELE